jgi:hydrogenase expression/formation protein HypC
MCLAIPVRITELLPEGMARAELDGVTMTIGVMMLDHVAIDDYVITHVGFAIARIDPVEAQHTLEMIRNAAQESDEATA